MTLHVEPGAGADQAASMRAVDMLRRHDWASTPLGAREAWPQSLRTTVDIMLGSGHAMCLAWGPDRTFFYNDAYAPFLGARHPKAFGMAFAEVWAEIWSDIGPLVERVFAGDTQTFQAMPLVMTRNGYAEDTWWDFSYSPVHDEKGTVSGLLNVAADATPRMLAERERDEALARQHASDAIAAENVRRVKLALAAGAIIGTWVWDIPADRFTIDESFARAFGLDPTLGREGIPLAQIVATVHPDDQVGLAEAINQAVARGGFYAHQYRTRRVDGNYYWLEAIGHVEQAFDGTPTSFPGVLIDIEERRAGEAERERIASELRDSEAFMRSVLSASSDCIKVLDIDARLVFMSEGGQRVMEVSDFNDIAGCPWPDFWKEEGNLAAKNAIAEAKAGRPATFQGYAETMKGNRRYWDVQVSPILSEDGRPERILSVSRDITALKAAEEARTVLAHEMAHRMKNSLAMVQAIATQTLRQAKTMEEGRVAISERLAALARAQDILTRSDFTEADVREVVEATIAPHQGKAERVFWSGPRIGLASQQALGLSLAIHELATNAAKYGALSNETGTVVMAWGHERGVFFFTWNEAGGPAVAEPTRRGFGSRLIERIVASYFDGDALLEFAPAGIRFRLIGASDRPEQQIQGRVA